MPFGFGGCIDGDREVCRGRVSKPAKHVGLNGARDNVVIQRKGVRLSGDSGKHLGDFRNGRSYIDGVEIECVGCGLARDKLVSSAPNSKECPG